MEKKTGNHGAHGHGHTHAHTHVHGRDACASARATTFVARAAASAHGCGHGSYEDALERLRATALRVTAPRKAMLRVLAAASGPVSIEALHSGLEAGVADLVTVYRSILAFEEIGLVQRHPLESGKNLYCLSDGRGRHHHHHVICRECGRMDVVEGCGAEKFEEEARRLGYAQISHVFEIYGVCGDCSARAEVKA
jgi:Fe2+ or Zn2+ uptake regulation protein